MTVGRTRTVALVGVRGLVVDVEADIGGGLPSFSLVGLPDSGMLQARDRVRSAAANSDCRLPLQRITVNLSPASVPKTGTGLDAGIAIAVLAAAGTVPAAPIRDIVHLGELGLDGAVKTVPGILPAVLAARDAGAARVVIPADALGEASLVDGIELLPVSTLRELVELHRGDRPPVPHPMLSSDRPGNAPAPPGDFADVIGQETAVWAATVAAAGAHNLLLVGPPGAGKSMIASRLPGILPPLSPDEALEVTVMRSVAGALDPASGLVTAPPFENPHHTASTAAIVGGGSGIARPGAASRAHRGVLFLDEAPEFPPRVLEALREPLETGEIVLHRARTAVRYPARFQLVLAANPCPCGRNTGTGRDCTCTPLQQRRYAARLSGPVRDRIDIRVDVEAVSRARGDTAPPSRELAATVASARAAQSARLAPHSFITNAEVPGTLLRGALSPGRAALADLDRALSRGLITMRGHDRVVRLGWTLADLAGADSPDRDHLSAALLLRAGKDLP